MDCHEDEITPFQDSVHAKVKGGKPATCQGCHGSIHTTSCAATTRSAPMSRRSTRCSNCGVCHEEMMEGYLSSVHARALFVSGLTEAAPSCSDCHGSHDIQRHDDRRRAHLAPEEPGDLRQAATRAC